LLKAGQAALALERLVETQRRFEALGERGEQMASVALTELADCLQALGRLDEAAATYEEAIARNENRKDFRGVAVGKGQLATVRMFQGRYEEAIASYEEVRTFFEQQNEPQSVAGMWHQIGIVHDEAGQYDAAEAAYRQSLEISTQMGNRDGQAVSLGQLGTLYDSKLNRPEEAVIFYRQAADIFAERGYLKSEGMARNNIAATLRQIQRYDEARAEIGRAIECYQPFGHAAESWKTFNILHNIETATGNPAAAQAAWRQARDVYLAYRQQGGYAQSQSGKLTDQILDSVQQGASDQAVQFLTQVMQSKDTPDWLKVSAPKILAILNGSRDSSLADDPALYYADAAEILFLIHQLGASDASG